MILDLVDPAQEKKGQLRRHAAAEASPVQPVRKAANPFATAVHMTRATPAPRHQNWILTALKRSLRHNAFLNWLLAKDEEKAPALKPTTPYVGAILGNRAVVKTKSNPVAKLWKAYWAHLPKLNLFPARKTRHSGLSGLARQHIEMRAKAEAYRAEKAAAAEAAATLAVQKARLAALSQSYFVTSGEVMNTTLHTPAFKGESQYSLTAGPGYPLPAAPKPAVPVRRAPEPQVHGPSGSHKRPPHQEPSQHGLAFLSKQPPVLGRRTGMPALLARAAGQASPLIRQR